MCTVSLICSQFFAAFANPRFSHDAALIMFCRNTIKMMMQCYKLPCKPHSQTDDNRDIIILLVWKFSLNNTKLKTRMFCDNTKLQILVMPFSLPVLSVGLYNYHTCIRQVMKNVILSSPWQSSHNSLLGELIVCAGSRENLSSGFSTMSDTNRAATEDG